MANNWFDSDKNDNRSGNRPGDRMGERTSSTYLDERRGSRDDRDFERGSDSDRLQSREGGYARDSGYAREGIYGRDDRMGSQSRERQRDSSMSSGDRNYSDRSPDRRGQRDRDLDVSHDPGHFDYGRSGGSDFSLGIGSVGNVSGRNLNRNYGLNRDAAYGEQYRQKYNDKGGDIDRDYGYGSDYGSYGRDSDLDRGMDRGTSRDFSRNHFNESSQGDPARYAGLASSNNRGMSQTLGGGLGSRPDHSGKGPKGWKRADDRIREDVSESLERHPDIDASEIEVDVKDGLVTLKGHVDARRTKRMAEDAVEHLPGVRDIRNELTVNQSLFEKAKELLTGESSTSSKSKTTSTTTTAKH